MLKLAVLGAQTLMGRELVQVLEPRECSVLPLATGQLSKNEEEGDVVVFAPTPSLLEGLDIVILVDTPQEPTLLESFTGRVLDLRDTPDPKAEPMPFAGAWPAQHRWLQGRSALEQVLTLLPQLVAGASEVGGTYLRSVACHGDRGLDGLMEQTVAILQGEEPKLEKLGYRAAFEMAPQTPRGNLMEVRVPAFHGDLLILHLWAAAGEELKTLEAPLGVKWSDHPASSRDVAVSAELLAHFSGGGRSGVLTLGFDPILWGVLRPVIRLLEL
jgi:hypothetical protein